MLPASFATMTRSASGKRARRGRNQHAGPCTTTLQPSAAACATNGCASVPAPQTSNCTGGVSDSTKKRHPARRALAQLRGERIAELYARPSSAAISGWSLRILQRKPLADAQAGAPSHRHQHGQADGSRLSVTRCWASSGFDSPSTRVREGAPANRSMPPPQPRPKPSLSSCVEVSKVLSTAAIGRSTSARDGRARLPGSRRLPRRCASHPAGSACARRASDRTIRACPLP